MRVPLRLVLALIATLVTGDAAMSREGLITIRSSFDPGATMKRLEDEVRAKGLTIFAHVDHAAGASEVGMQLRPTDLLIFGAAKGGTPLMQANQTIGIDLPLKALVWQDETGATFLSYNDPGYIARRHGLDEKVKAVVDALSGVLRTIAAKVTSAQ